MSEINHKVRIFEVTESSWLKRDGGYAGRDALLGFDIDPATLPEISDADLNISLAREGLARKELQRVGLIGKSPEQIVEIVENNALSELLFKWVEIHKKNRALVVRQAKGDILIVPDSQNLLKAADILKSKTLLN